MSDHAWILENLAAYLTGGLEPAERERLEQHVQGCVPCADALANTRALDVTVTGLFFNVRPSASLEDHAIQTLRKRLAEAWILPVPALLGLAAAALVLIGLTGSVASQVLVQGGLASPSASEVPTGSMGGALMGYQLSGRSKKEGKIAENLRSSMMDKLAQVESTHQPRVAREWDYESYRNVSPPKAQLPESSTSSRMSDQGWTGAGNGPAPSAAGGESGARTARPEGILAVPTLPAPATDGTNSYWYAPGKELSVERTGEDVSGRGFEKKGQKGRGENRELRIQDEAKLHEPVRIQENAKLQERVRESTKDKKRDAQPDEKKPQDQPGPRKIVIRTGEVEYEVQSFDAAVATITRLLKNIKGGFIATVNSDKLANGKVRGSVVVRVPPENLDELILELRTNLSKSGDLKNQRLGSLDITKQYTDLESELRAARAMEERLLQIIKTGKGEIKDLLAAEKELGNWRTRIEKIEGELRYYANQVALSTLTITLYEKEIQAPFGIVEREQVQMGLEVEDVDQAYQAAQKAVREAKGHITRAELQQPFQGQFSARLDFEVAPDATGPLRDRLKQLGTVARFDISRVEETEGGTGKPSDGKTRRNDTRFHVHLYNLTNVAPRETVQINLASTDVEASFKTLLARVEKAEGRIVASNLNSARGNQAQATLQFEVKAAVADDVLADVKAAGEVMRLNVAESTDRQNTTPKKRGFRVQLLALSAAAARETDEMQLACTDVAASYRAVQDAVLKAKGQVRNAQLNEQDRRHVTATLDFEIRRTDEAVLRAALTTAGDIYTRKASRAADADNVVDSKVHWLVTFLNQANIPPRETYVFGVEVADVDQTAAMMSALVGDRQGRIVEANIARERTGRVTGKLIYDVPLAKVHELLDALKSAGTVRVQQSIKHPEVPDSPLAIARLDVTLSNQELIVPTDEGFGASIRRGVSDSFAVLSWSVRFLILGLCVLLPWALVVWVLYRLIVRMRPRNTPPASAT